jgi:hypothetical protein
MDPKEATRAAAALTQVLKDTKDLFNASRLAYALSAVTARMEAKEAAQAIATLFRVVADRSDLSSLDSLLPTTSGPKVLLQGASVTGTGAGHLLTTLPVLSAAAESFPCHLSTQQLVELLKLPACVGYKRRRVLDYLGYRFQRRFADLWDFVAWAQKHEPDLDLTTPPQRPGR